ncbi:DUF3592 domain-containing protein [Trueperella bialowiezensis]|uniref:Protein of uncharacterized function (DUF3592) n=1 Tax=Trueperella bialowiezensis TaxID=312285 RepID=A0A3S4WG26_9ACTO|nr:DUF3592 domain-containing protein [Trueperella bialowiezensis]VEI13071.1 Protein of uncharacterised function (DUF3592) [Trueperella bialowiezensis]
MLLVFFFLYIFPLFFLLMDDRPYSTTEFAVVLFVIGVVMWTIFTVFLVMLGFDPYRKAKAHRKLRETGVPVIGEIIRSIQAGDEKGKPKFRLRVRFQNLAGSKIERDLDVVDEQPQLRRYARGNRINLRLNQNGYNPPYVVDTAEFTPKFSVGYLRWAVFNIAYSVGLFLVEYHLYGQGVGLRFLCPLSNWLMPPVIFLVFVLFILILSGGNGLSSVKNARQAHELTLYGVASPGEIVDYRQTGVYKNENPQVNVTVQFLDQRGEIKQRSLREVVPLVDMHKLRRGPVDVLYLPSDPDVFEIVEES